MNPRLIRMIIVLMFLAMTGLVGLQIFWIKQSLDQREDQFTQNAQGAITNAAREFVDKKMNESLVRLMEKQDFEKMLVRQLDSLDKVEKNLKKQQKENPANAYNEYGSYEKQMWGRLPTAGPGDQGAVDNPHVFFPEFVPDSSKELQKKLKKTQKILERRSELVNRMFLEMLLQLADINISKKDSVLLDSLIAQELVAKGIRIKYDFGVYNIYQERFLFAKGNNIKALSTSGYTAPMSLDPFYKENILVVYFPNKTNYLLNNLMFLLLASAFLIIIIIFSFAYTVNIIFKQKKISEIKNDLINNITHELKTPISTISLACQAIKDPDMLKSESIVANYITMISEENTRLGLLVENVLQSAVFERGDYKLKIRKVDLHARLEKVITSLSIQARSRNIHIVKKFEAHDYILEADDVLITNLVFNLVDNAIKYSSEQDPYVELVTSNPSEGHIRIEVADNGIGISRDDQKRIFEKLYRVPTGNVHNVKGFGLGLSYVKSIVERHRGTITVQSELGEGSRFIVDLPIKNILMPS